ncbi:hypothetical protein GCM10023238_15830 [Streptomyces heliomycini]
MEVAGERRTVLDAFPQVDRVFLAGGGFAHARRLEGLPAEVVMDLATDTFSWCRPGGRRRGDVTA